MGIPLVALQPIRMGMRIFVPSLQAVDLVADLMMDTTRFPSVGHDNFVVILDHFGQLSVV
ncbi:hypothetical protein [Ectothiorhodospira variabilis]|uniref:hypothetical protein n=1 Tax=Ectothiorhodospira variabilis TaxID=505694 RepID=UPI001EFB4F7E|nr:hypothetical protein [Ectothiorhodospira variabilis]MCG5497651.1 hypothetical protein [Ectothiorhodospira variabilis]